MDDTSIWSAYEQNCLYYGKCKDLRTCPNKYNECCYCSRYMDVHPTLIADCGFASDCVIPSVNKKCYIAFGEICPICIEPITTKSSAWLTPCGHAFHKKCLIDNYHYRDIHNMCIQNSNEIPCPVCREGLVCCCVGLDSLDKYNSKN